MPIIDPYSVSAFPLIIKLQDGTENHGTAFFYKKNNRLFLVTNWHNLSGRNPSTGQPRNPNGSLPVEIGIPFHIQGQLGGWSDPVTYPINNPSNVVLWRQHSTHGQKVDIAVMEVVPPTNAATYPINEIEHSDDMQIAIGMEVFVLGFPITLFTGIFPIWKRATIATEYDFSVRGLPSFLVDTATREGMSGSPVILRQRGGYTTENGSQVLGPATSTRFLGVYSGRYGADIPDQAQLGIVWRKELIEEIIDNGIVGSFTLV